MCKKILITGANGFVGSFLSEEAISQGFKVFAGIRKTSNTSYLKHLPVEYVYLDFEDKAQLKECLSNYHFDYIIHNAGLTQSKNSLEFDRMNFRLTANFIDVLTENNMIPEKFIYNSSLSAYGPGKNGSNQPVKVTDKQNPITLYGKSKLRAQNYLYNKKELPVIIFMPTAIYGPREKNFAMVYKLLLNGIEPYMGLKMQQLTFIYVKDIARLFITALKSDIYRGLYFVSDGHVYSNRQFFDYAKPMLGVKTIKMKVPIFLVTALAKMNEIKGQLIGKPSIFNSEKVRELRSRNWQCDISPLKRDFGFNASYTLKEGIKETIQWYKEQHIL
jgi:nucleoside-diphosphate-sugar epimerase